MTEQRALITGATGFVGGWLADALAAAHPGGTLFGTAHGPAPLAPPPPQITLLPCDLTDQAAVADMIARTRPNRVFHLAGFAATGHGAADLVHRVNVEATVNLLDALAAAKRPCRVLLASSGYVYGPTAPHAQSGENDLLAPLGVYAASKAAMEKAAQFFAANELSVVVARAFNHTGPRQTTDFVVPAFAQQIARIERGLEAPIVRVGNLEAERDFLHVGDVVEAYRRLLMAPGEPERWRVVNVCSGVATSIRSILDALVGSARVPLSVEPDPVRARPSDLPRCVGNPARLEALTGWKAKISLTQTLTETLDYWRAGVM